MKYITLICALFLACCSGDYEGVGRNSNVSRRSNVTKIDDRDTKKHAKTIYNALEYGNDGAKIYWSNIDTGGHGYVMPHSITYNEDAGLICRKYESKIYYNNKFTSYIESACKKKNKWLPCNANGGCSSVG